MIHRDAEKELITLADQFRAVAVTGPRQSGKTTLVKSVFPDKPYVNFENPDTLRYIKDDAVGFLNNYIKGAIFDEVQRAPELFSYLQGIIDADSTRGRFILTGSNNFLLHEKISQSLAGRVAYLNLLPLTYHETQTNEDPWSFALKGGYPEIHSEGTDPYRWYQNYIRTYVERDVRQIRNISNLTLFDRFIRLCAGRTGQLINLSSLGIETGVDHKTINDWLNVLEAGFVIYRLKPFYKNYNKRLTKMQKLYFFDTGLLCNLLGIDHLDILRTHPLRGNIFENLIFTELIKMRWNKGLQERLYFWRDHVGHEVDFLLEDKSHLIPVEVKAGQTVTGEYFKNIRYFNKISNTTGGIVVYAGKETRKYSDGIKVVPFDSLGL